MEVGSSSALLLEVPAVLSAVASAESDRIKLLLPRACERSVSSLVFLPLPYLLRFLFFAAWLALEQAVQGARLVFLISGLVCSCFASLVPGLDKSPFSRIRQETYCHVSPWLFPSCCGSRRIGGTTGLFAEGAHFSPDSSARCFLSASAHGAPLASQPVGSILL